MHIHIYNNVDTVWYVHTHTHTYIRTCVHYRVAMQSGRRLACVDEEDGPVGSKGSPVKVFPCAYFIRYS